jgi:hypothetical protein
MGLEQLTKFLSRNHKNTESLGGTCANIRIRFKMDLGETVSEGVELINVSKFKAQ